MFGSMKMKVARIKRSSGVGRRLSMLLTEAENTLTAASKPYARIYADPASVPKAMRQDLTYQGGEN
jgi:hypothetical protein